MAKYRTGQWFLCNGKDVALLVQVQCGMVALIGLDGNRWNEPVNVERVKEITQSEMDKITRSINKYELLEGQASVVVEQVIKKKRTFKIE